MKNQLDTQPVEKKMSWYTLALMAFTAVWGFGNVINGFSESFSPCILCLTPSWLGSWGLPSKTLRAA